MDSFAATSLQLCYFLNGVSKPHAKGLTPKEIQQTVFRLADMSKIVELTKIIIDEIKPI